MAATNVQAFSGDVEISSKLTAASSKFSLDTNGTLKQAGTNNDYIKLMNYFAVASNWKIATGLYTGETAWEWLSIRAKMTRLDQDVEIIQFNYFGNNGASRVRDSIVIGGGSALTQANEIKVYNRTSNGTYEIYLQIDSATSVEVEITHRTSTIDDDYSTVATANDGAIDETGLTKIYDSGTHTDLRLTGGSVGIGGTTSPAAVLNVYSNNLGTTAGNSTDIFKFGGNSTGAGALILTSERVSNGSDWTTTGLRLQRIVDSVKMGYVQFGSSGDLTGELIFGNGDSTERVRISPAGRLGVGISSPLAPLHVKPINNTDNVENVLLDFRSEFPPHGYLGIFATETHTGAVGPDLRFKGTVYNGTSNPTLRDVLSLKPYGYVGIGTNGPGQTLTVNDPAISPTFGLRRGTYGDYVVYMKNTQGNFQTVNLSDDAVILVGKGSGTNRSINAEGSINGNGLDYAEYMKKSRSDLVIKKGDIVGVNNDGELTNVFSESIQFVVKSTNPSYVGGSSWSQGTVSAPKNPSVLLTVDEYSNVSSNEATLYSYWEEQKLYANTEQLNTFYEENEKYLEDKNIHRAPYDRIAFCGQVPVNVYNATPGQYIIPKQTEDDTISYELTNTTTFEQYQISIGKVLKIQEDGRAFILVKIS